MTILLLIIPIFSVILLGIVTARFGLFDSNDTNSFIKLVFYLVMPVELFVSTATANLSDLLDWPYILAYFISSLILMAISIYASKKYFNHSNAETTLNLMASNVTNSAYLALPLFIILFSNPIPAITVLMIQNLVTVAVLISLEVNTQSRHSNPLVLLARVFLKNPIVLASIMGFFVCGFKLKLPLVLMNTLSFIGKPASFLALFALGLSLVTDHQPMDRKNKIDTAFLVFLKTVMHPILGLILGKYIFHLSNFSLTALVLMCAMPSAKNTFIFAKKYNINSNKYNQVTVITTLLTLISICLILY